MVILLWLRELVLLNMLVMSDNDYELLEHNKGLDGEYDEKITSWLCFSSRSYH